MHPQQVLWQLDAAHRIVLAVQRLQNQVFQTRALLRTAGNIADICSLAEVIQQVSGALRPANSPPNRRSF